MIPLIPLSLAMSSCLTGTQAVNTKTISGNEPPHQRSTSTVTIIITESVARKARDSIKSRNTTT
jgi:hypothetical protein